MTPDLFPNSPNPSPKTDQDLLDWLQLIRSRRVGPATFFRLLKSEGTARAALEALPDVARAAKVSDYRLYNRDWCARELQAGRKFGASLIAYGSHHYPRALAEIKDPPPLIWVKGRLDKLNAPAVALIGARNGSALGTRMARRLAEGLGTAGLQIVSGLARGIDTAAHEAALGSGTIGVMAGGIDVAYPAENSGLMQKILAEGALLSEQPLGLSPQARHFPQRNRLVSGLSMAVVVVEAAAKSGSLITASCAADQGRDVLAVPGHPMDGRASGSNFLIRDGATLVRSVEDVLAVLPPLVNPSDVTQPQLRMVKEVTPPKESGAPSKAPPDTLRQDILSLVGVSPMLEDQLIRDLKRPSAEVIPEIMTLELSGHLERQAGGLVALAS